MTNTCYNMDEPQKHYKKADSKDNRVYDSIYMKYPKDKFIKKADSGCLGLRVGRGINYKGE